MPDTEHHLSTYLLHWMGLALISGDSQSDWRLGTHMLRSSSELGFMPSTLTLVRVFRSMPSQFFNKAASTIMYRAANARFVKSLSNGTDPNAFTLEGITLANEGANANAMAMFRKATDAWRTTDRKGKGFKTQTGHKATGNDAQAPVPTPNAKGTATSPEFTLPPPRKPRWDWEVSNVLGQANILLKQPNTAKKAHDLFKVAALELDNPLGFMMLAKLMDGPRDSPERRTYLLKAAISGAAEACRELGELEKMAAAKSTRSKERDEHEHLSKEWFLLAEGEDISDYAKVGDVDGQE